MASMQQDRIFVYGTLRRGGGADAFLAACRFLRAATVRGTLYDLGDYPALTLDGSDQVHGEIWSCTPETLMILDSYEGVAEGLFERLRVAVDDEQVWTYVAGHALRTALDPDRILRPACWQPPNRRWSEPL